MFLQIFSKNPLKIGLEHATNLTEEKRIYLVNFTAISTVIAFIVMTIIGYLFNKTLVGFYSLIGYCVEVFILFLVLYLQFKSNFFWAKLLLVSSSFITCHIFNVYIEPGVSAEFFYIIPVLMSLYLFDSKLVSIIFLVISIILFFDFLNFKEGFNPDRSHFLVLFLIEFFIVYYVVETNKKAEKKLQKQKKELNELNNFQNHFFVNITHDIRTPLTLIKGHVNSLLRENTKTHTVQKSQKINVEVSKIDSLVNSIIDIAKLESNTLVLDKTAVSVNKLIQKEYLAFEALFKQKEINFSIQLSEEDYFINADVIYFEKVVNNILLNAYKYTSNGDSVALVIKKIADAVVISISDTGIGVEESELEVIFNRFYQSNNTINKAGGSGIGLAFSKQIIELHSGSIKASINKKLGLTISISLPIFAKIEHIALSEQRTKIHDFSSDKKVLIVDDNKEMREYLKDILSAYILLEAENGKMALEIIATTKIDALVTDFMMPVLDGEALVKNIKEQKLNIPTIVLTARADVESKLSMLQLGVDDYLKKPFIEDELLYRLQNILFNAEERQNFSIENAEESELQSTNETVVKAKQIVEENLSNAYFGVAQLSDILKISERTLYRIIKKETGLNSNLFIREIKLNMVRKQINNGSNLTLQQLALSVGLKNGTYLNQLYKDHFGKAIHEN